MDLSKISPVIFDQYWHRVEWASRQRFKGDHKDQFERMKTPNTNVIKALTKMFDAFYPEESHKTIASAQDQIRKYLKKKCELDSLIEDYLPWIMHKALFDMKENKLKDLSEQKYQEILTGILEKDWLLSWHWRAVLPVLKSCNPNNKSEKLIIQISHIRKWEILLCYSVKTELISEYEISEIPLEEKKLKRAPIFGISHRLKGWDTYRLFYQEDVINDITKLLELKKTKKELAYILGRHDYYYVVNKVDLDKKKNCYTWILSPFIVLEPEKTPFDKNICVNTSEKFYYNPPDLIDIPSFGEHRGIPQLLSSDHYCEAIYELTEVLNDPTAKSVLLIAPPGSGKEKLSDFAFHCKDRMTSSGNFIATTLAGLNAVEAAKLLFSYHSEVPFNPDTYVPGNNNRDGLVFQAVKGALFIDEIDKTDKSIRDLLLRLLESGDVTVPESSIIIKLGKAVPLYIFAGSLNRSLMFQLGPPDFWTRISHVIEIAHPLGIDDIDKSKQVIKDYLWMFWCLHVKDFMNKNIGKTSADNPYAGPLIDFYKNLYVFLLKREVLNFATEVLAEELSGRGKPLVSIRTLRSIVARSIFKLVDILLYSKFDTDPIEKYKAIMKEEKDIRTFCEWFNRLAKLIECENRKKSDDCQTIDFLGGAVLESFRKAIRSGIALVQ
jgi:hypothetical protein